MPFPDSLIQLTAALADNLTSLDPEKRREYISRVMTLTYEHGIVDGKLQMLDKMVKDFQAGQTEKK
jgi:hypothetical protein